MHLDDFAIRVMQEDLMPTRNRPAAIVRIADPQLVTPTHEAFNVIGTEAEVTLTHRVNKLLHLETSIEVSFGPVELNVSIGQEVHGTCVSAVLSIAADHGVLGIRDRAQIEQCLVELRQPGQVVRADVHVMELEFHDFSSVDDLELPTAACGAHCSGAKPIAFALPKDIKNSLMNATMHI